ncbi:lysophospholipid acyltransferase family protein [Opitutia bacterium ISCC 51]|nr:lysophospholipid acyltransferase family protein [Opitutae bacterium ISCC 51]QXD30047.1 lysophospholipid acyltransferase family protein [Opitutae bacterium ISCC 52]
MADKAPQKKGNPLKAICTAFLLRCIIRLMALTYRVQIASGEGKVQELLDCDSPVILCAWHNRIFYMGSFLEKRLTRRGFRLTQMVSLSKDGDVGYYLGKWANIKVVRGSSNRGGSRALRGMFRVLKKEKFSIVILPDGSQGPRYEAKPGAIVLAQLSGAPIYLFSFSVDRCWRVKSWDRLIIPKPFSKISVKFSEPIHVPRELSKVQLEEQRVILETALNEL